MAAPMKKFLTRVIPQTLDKPNGSMIFLHGSGDTGQGALEWVNSVLGVKQLSFPHIRILYPTAPARPYTPNMGEYSNVWYDRKQISPDAPDDVTVETTAADLCQLIQAEEDLGIPRSRIIVGGFSMGGGMAFQLGYRFLPDLAGVFAMSSFLSTKSLVYQELKKNVGPFPALYQSHCTEDPLVLYSWGKSTYDTLTSLGVKGPFYTQSGVYHELEQENMVRWLKWVNEIIPLQRPE